MTDDRNARVSVNAYESGAAMATIGPADAGFIGWTPESHEDNAAYSVAGVTQGLVAPTRITSPAQPLQQPAGRQ